MLRFALKIGLLGVFLGLLSIAGVVMYIVPDLPDVEELRDIKMQTPLRIYSSQGSLISEYGEKRRIPVQIGQVPEQFTNAFSASEDDRFYSHPGVD